VILLRRLAVVQALGLWIARLGIVADGSRRSMTFSTVRLGVGPIAWMSMLRA
jgi:hypothetical protein